MMLVFLAISFAATTVSAQYGAANNPPAAQPSYSSNTVYYPPAVYDSHYWDYSSRERKHCPRLTTYVGEFPGIPEAAFYPPVIRYVKYGGKTTALVSCDRPTKNINFLFARYNKTRDIRSAYFVSMGSTAGVTLKCNRDERRFEGIVIDLADNDIANGGDYSKKVEITQLTCLGIEKTVIGILGEIAVKKLANDVAKYMNDNNFFSNVGLRRKKRDIELPFEYENDDGDFTDAVTTEAVTVAATEAKVADAATVTGAAAGEKVTDAVVETTETVVKHTEAPVATTESATQKSESATQKSEAATQKSEAAVVAAETTPSADATPAPGSIDAVKESLADLGKILGQIF